MRVHRPLSVRSKLLVSAALVGVLIAAVGAVVHSAFTSTVRNSGNTFEAGSIALSDSVERGSALFQLKGMTPGSSATRCIKVSYRSTGGLASTVRLHGVTTGALAQHLRMRIVRGTFEGAVPSDGSCTGFAPTTARHMFDDTLANFPASYAGGISDSDSSWTDGESAAYRIEVSLNDTNEAQGGSAAHELVFEARSS